VFELGAVGADDLHLGVARHIAGGRQQA